MKYSNAYKSYNLRAPQRDFSEGIEERQLEKVAAILEKGEENFEGVFAWAPSLRYWLKDPDYIFWLGAVRW